MTAEVIEKRLPAPTPQRQVGADREGHPGGVKARGGAAGKPKMGWGLVFIIWFTTKGAKTAKDSTAMALRPSRSLRCSIS